MVEISDLLKNNTQNKSTAISLCGKLEAIVGNYFLSEVTNGFYGGLWNSVYFDSNINSENESVECIPQNLIGYVDREDRWAFILDSYAEKFKKDTEEYGLDYICVPSLIQSILQCRSIDKLPSEFSGIVWINDDFMNDENIPFDFEAFEIIDKGEKYLNPKHFSVNELIGVTR